MSVRRELLRAERDFLYRFVRVNGTAQPSDARVQRGVNADRSF